MRQFWIWALIAVYAQEEYVRDGFYSAVDEEACPDDSFDARGGVRIGPC